MAPARLSRTPARTPASTSRGEPTGELPPLQPLAAPLHESALRSLQNLPLKKDLTKLKNHQQASSAKFSEIVATINEYQQEFKAKVEGRTARRKEKGDGPGEEEEEELRQLTERVSELSAQLDEGIRKGIDSQAKLEARETALGFVIDAMRQQRHDRAAAASVTQSTLGASQFRQQGAAGTETDDEEGNDDSQAPTEHAALLLHRKEEELENGYTALSMKLRYASHNQYIEFKRSRHFASNPTENAPPLPNANTWFRDLDSNDQSEAQGENDGVISNPNAERMEQEEEDDYDSGSDIQAVSERVNIRCPITLLPMQDPVSSTKCPHSFEKEAIWTMIQGSRPPGTDPRREVPLEQKTIQCPECHVMLTTADLVPDLVLKRQIRRIVAAEQAREKGSDSDDDEMDGVVRGGRTNVEELSSQIWNDSTPAAARVKQERFPRPSQPGGQVSLDSDEE